MVDLTVSAVLPVAAGGSILKTGAGTLLLSGASTAYTGGFTLNEGATVATVAGALGANTSTVAFGGGSLELRNDANTTFTARLNAVTSGATITVNRVNAAGTVTTHTMGMLAIGNGNTLSVVAGANINTGTAYGLTLGATTLSSDATFDIANNGAGLGTLTLGALGDGGGARTITKNGAGTLTLNTLASGLVAGTTVNLNSGTINQGAANALGVNSPALSITPTTGTGLYNITAAVGQTLGPITLGGADGTTANITTGTGTVTLAGNVTYDAGANPNGATISGLLNVGSTQKTFSIGDSSAAADLTVLSVVTGAAGGSILKTGSGMLLLSGASTAYTGGFALDEGATVATVAGTLGASTSTVTFGGGSLELRNDANTTFTAGLNAVNSSGTLTVNRASAAGTVTTHTMGTLAIGNGNTLSVVAGGNISTGTAYGLTLGATTFSGDGVLDVANNDTGPGTLTLGALTQSGGAHTVTKQGAGTLTLGTAADVSFTGSAINVNDGVLISNLAGALSSVPTTANTTNVTVNNPGELWGTVTGSFRSSGTGTPSEAINLTGGTVRLYSNTAATFGGNLTYSDGSLIVDHTAGGGTLTQTMNSLSIGSVT